MRQCDLQLRDYVDFGYYILYLGIITLTAIYIKRSLKAPIDAVRIGRQLNDEQENDTRKRNLFLTLFAYRGMPNSFKFVEALNQIEILFHDNPQILKAWYDLYNSMNIGERQETAHDRDTWDDLRVLLLDEMSRQLKYSSLQQLRIKKAYYSRGYQVSEMFDSDLRHAALQFFQTGKEIYELLIEQGNAKKPTEEKSEQPIQSVQTP